MAKVHTCAYCKTQFESSDSHVRLFCSCACFQAARRKATHLRNVQLAKELGVSVEEVCRRLRHGKINVKGGLPASGCLKIKRPKSYAEIKAANRKRRLVSGWRGQPVMGGGPVLQNDPYLKTNEYKR